MKKSCMTFFFIMCLSVATACGAGASHEKKTNAYETEYETEELSVSFTNPISDIEKDAWFDYGTGDPYVMRYNGIYYLYMSTRDTEVGVKVFSSKNLVDWNYEGFCTEEKITKCAYAPEVVYYNGKFYMYTSPFGKGHYVLESDSPTGPFKLVTDNMGMSIDGSVFIDDDGKWYFYHASDTGIKAHEMKSPTKMDGLQMDVNAFMNGWTEGPMVIKTDGNYYLTYTGNHVFSKGYRINVGVGKKPTSFKPEEENPVLINTLGETYGIGHSSSVKGPDLDSYYIVYHTLVGRAAQGMPKRVMNIDRIVFNGRYMDVLGPTTTDQPSPKMPDIYSYFRKTAELMDWDIKKAKLSDLGLVIEDGGYVISNGTVSGDFTAEYNMYSESASGLFGGYFAYLDNKNYGSFSFDAAGKNIIVDIVKGKETESFSFEIAKSFDEDPLLNVNETIQIERFGDEFEIYYNDRLLGNFTAELSGDKFGYFTKGCDAIFGFIGVSHDVKGSSAKSYEKPVPGTIQAVHFSEADGEIGLAENDNKNSVETLQDKVTLDYIVNVSTEGYYDFSLVYKAENGAEYTLLLDEERIAEGTLKESPEYVNYVNRGILLSAGTHILKLEVSGKEACITSFDFLTSEEVEAFEKTYDEKDEDFLYSDGEWVTKDGSLYITNSEGVVGKRLYGSDGYGDYKVSTRLRYAGNISNAGVLVRAKNPALGNAGNSPLMGINFVQGYFVGILRDKVILAKMNYDYKIVAEASIEDALNRDVELSVTVKGNSINVEVDGEEKIDYTDENAPFYNGACGLRTNQSVVRFDYFNLEKVD